MGLSCAACERFAGYRLGAAHLDPETGEPRVYPDVELVNLGRRDEEGRDLGVVVIEEPNPLAGQPITFECVYIHHGGHKPGGRPPGLPDAYLLVGVQRQILEFLDHLKAEAAPDRWVEHVQRAGGEFRPEYRWLRELVRYAQEASGSAQHLPWKQERKALARRVLARVLDLDEPKIRGRLDRWRASGGLEGFRAQGGLG